ncbi:MULTISPECIES: hypothetical protein [Bacillus]|uniref:hypothetical protein n=1 Tax=Bacillus TaxID=1386 RepID=UPI00097AE970|nr:MULTISPECIES: hypothetical protein [Bacillus]MBC8623623.1 hypothetical protein [Robertmurraya crescens]MCY8037989.1 hypothetical protein [Bacillus paralicheniformis]MCY8150986.1 hypothetical protein [Bacillus paralicheniformis]MCY8179423.1 hypothetical protein [Bacillus paralicheniformis]MCY9421633.1 hypothetical protein [Bacillus paralicheniformis]
MQKSRFWVVCITMLLTINLFPLYQASAEEEFTEVLDENSEYYELGESVKIEGVLEPATASSDFQVSCIACVNNRYVVKTIKGPTKVKKRVRFLTSSWAKASSYTWSKTQSASSTVSSNVGISAKGISSQLGVSNTVTTSYSVAITIPANSKKYSKLAFYSDYNKRYVRVRNYLGNSLISTKYAYHYAPRKDTYLQVIYK